MAYVTATDYLQDRAAETARLVTPERYPPVDDVLLLLSAAAGDRGAYTAEQIEAADAALAILNQGLTEAALTIDSYLGQRYSLPLAQSRVDASPIGRHARALARYYLHSDHIADADDPVASAKKDAERWLRDVVEKRASLGGGEATTPTRTGAVFIGGPARVFGRGKGRL